MNRKLQAVAPSVLHALLAFLIQFSCKTPQQNLQLLPSYILVVAVTLQGSEIASFLLSFESQGAACTDSSAATSQKDLAGSRFYEMAFPHNYQCNFLDLAYWKYTTFSLHSRAFPSLCAIEWRSSVSVRHFNWHRWTKQKHRKVQILSSNIKTLRGNSVR